MDEDSEISINNLKKLSDFVNVVYHTNDIEIMEEHYLIINAKLEIASYAINGVYGQIKPNNIQKKMLRDIRVTYKKIVNSIFDHSLTKLKQDSYNIKSNYANIPSNQKETLSNDFIQLDNVNKKYVSIGERYFNSRVINLDEESDDDEMDSFITHEDKLEQSKDDYFKDTLNFNQTEEEFIKDRNEEMNKIKQML